MVKLTWEDKESISERLPNLIKEVKNKFNIFEELSSESYDEKNDLKSRKWKNMIFWGDNLEVAAHLLSDYENTIDLIYIDPPFYSGVKYRIEINEDGEIYKDTAYIDNWDNDIDQYLQMMYERLALIKSLLSKISRR